MNKKKKIVKLTIAGLVCINVLGIGQFLFRSPKTDNEVKAAGEAPTLSGGLNSISANSNLYESGKKHTALTNGLNTKFLAQELIGSSTTQANAVSIANAYANTQLGFSTAGHPEAGMFTSSLPSEAEVVQTLNGAALTTSMPSNFAKMSNAWWLSDNRAFDGEPVRSGGVMSANNVRSYTSYTRPAYSTPNASGTSATSCNVKNALNWSGWLPTTSGTFGGGAIYGNKTEPLPSLYLTQGFYDFDWDNYRGERTVHFPTGTQTYADTSCTKPSSTLTDGWQGGYKTGWYQGKTQVVTLSRVRVYNVSGTRYVTGQSVPAGTCVALLGSNDNNIESKTDLTETLNGLYQYNNGRGGYEGNHLYDVAFVKLPVTYNNLMFDNDTGYQVTSNPFMISAPYGYTSWGQTGSCTSTAISQGQASVRPGISFTNTNNVVNVLPANATTDPSLQYTTFNTYTQNKSLAANTNYKLEVNDTTQKITNVTANSGILKIENVGGVKTVYVRRGTNRIALNVTNVSNGPSNPNVYSALAYGKDGSTVKRAYISNSVTPNGTVYSAFDLNGIMDNNKPGESKKINLYSEEVRMANYANFISSTPYTINVVIVGEQELGFTGVNDSTTLSNPMMYGETYQVTAQVNSSNGLGWANTSIVASTPDTDKVTITSSAFNNTTGKTIITLKPKVGSGENGSQLTFTLKLNKTSNVDYYEPATEITKTIRLKRRKIKISAVPVLLYTGESFYPPYWSKTTQASDATMTGTPIVPGDGSPYRLETIDIGSSNGRSIPVFNGVDLDGMDIIDISNANMKWGIAISSSGVGVPAFEKKYEVEKNGYHLTKNPNAVLTVRDASFEGVRFDTTQRPENTTVMAGWEYQFQTVIKYPLINNLYGAASSADYQGFHAQCEINTSGSTWENTETASNANGTCSVEYDESGSVGIAKITYKGNRATINDEGRQFRFRAWNNRDTQALNNPTSTIARLYIGAEPTGYIQVPTQTTLAKLSEDKIGIADDDQTSGLIKLIPNTNGLAKPGSFNIYAPVNQLYLTLNGTPQATTPIIKKYKVDLYKKDKITPVNLGGLLTTLTYESGAGKSNNYQYYLQTSNRDIKEIGQYRGSLIFGIEFVPGGTS